jgi:hypothetical protein
MIDVNRAAENRFSALSPEAIERNADHLQQVGFVRCATFMPNATTGLAGNRDQDLHTRSFATFIFALCAQFPARRSLGTIPRSQT